MQLKCAGCLACGLQTSATGLLSDGSSTADYPNGAECEWIITSSDARQITITFSEFSTQQDLDYVQVMQCFDIACNSYSQLAKLSGTYTTVQTFTSLGSFLKVTFSSDSTITGAGFTANWISRNVSYSYIVRQDTCIQCELNL